MATGEMLLLAAALKMKLSIKRASQMALTQRRTSTTEPPSTPVATTDDYLAGPQQSVQRRVRDPRVALFAMLDGVWSQLRALPAAVHFAAPVNARDVVDYHAIVKVHAAWWLRRTTCRCPWTCAR